MSAEELRELADWLAADDYAAQDRYRAAAYLRACADALDAGPVAWHYDGRDQIEVYPLAMPAPLRLPEPMTDEEVAALIHETEYLPTDHAVRYLVETGECRVKEANEYPFHCDDIRTLLDRLKAAEAENERLREFERSAALTLPGVYYMDPPDGGDASLLKQLQRMSNDAARYRLLRRKFAIISNGEGNAEFCPINLPRPTYIAPNTAIELDTALDRERLGMDGAERPPTPVGWSDTDWIKHLQEQDEQPHPLAGQHINQGSMDAAADACEAEYNAARGIT